MYVDKGILISSFNSYYSYTRTRSAFSTSTTTRTAVSQRPANVLVKDEDEGRIGIW